MDWNGWEKKRIFVQLKNGRVYQGTVERIDFSMTPLIFITIIDKFGKIVDLCESEIVRRVEE